MRGMSASTLAAVKASPVAELPASVLRIAAGFASLRVDGLDAVVIKPGSQHGEVIITGAQPCRVVQITAEGTCQRQFGLPVKALRAAMALDRNAEHVVIVDGDIGMLSLRTFSPTCTVSVMLPEAQGASLDLPPTTPGACQVTFATPLLLSLLRDLQPLADVHLEPYSNGLAVSGQGDGYTVFALLAGVEA
jgi:hypothetical protein